MTPDDLAGLAARASQPPPTPNDRPAVVPQVIADLRARMELGKSRYGTPLQPFNGRSALRDAYEEAQDLTVYLKQELIERAERDAVYEAMRAALKPFADAVGEYPPFDKDCRKAQAALARAAELDATKGA